MCSMAKVPFTPDGYKKLKEELSQLKTVDRQQVIRDISEARDHGDLSENAEYDAAKNRQSFIEGRINYLGDRLTRAEIIDPTQIAGLDQVMFGVFVTLSDEDSVTRILRYTPPSDTFTLNHVSAEATAPRFA